MKILTLLTSLALSLSLEAQSPSFEWALGFGGTSSEWGNNITSDNQGNVYVIGHFSETIDFDPGPGTTNLTSANVLRDIFIQKLDSAGNLVWVKQLGGLNSDHGSSIEVDGSGNVYLTGYFGGTVDFDPGPGVTSLTSMGSDDIFIEKLDPSGNLLWVKQIGGTQDDGAFSLDIDGDNNVYVAGYFRNTVDFDPNVGTAALTSAGEIDGFVVKLDNNGNYIWAKNVGGTSYDYIQDISVDSAGNCHATGAFAGTADIDPGPSVSNHTSLGTGDIFVLKLNSNGDYQWSHSYGSTNQDRGWSITNDENGFVYFTGDFVNNTVDFDPGVGTDIHVSNGGADMFIQKLDSLGNMIWTKSIGGPSVDLFRDISLENDGLLYLAGYFFDTVDFDPGPGTHTLISNGAADIVIQKLDTSGNFIWATSFGGDGEDVGYSVTLGSDNGIYTTGYYADTTDFDPDAGVFELISEGSSDIFVHKLGQCTPNTGSDTTTSCDNYLWPASGNTYNSTGTYSTTLMNAAGCDSVVTLNLTITNSNTGSETATFCDSYTWSADGNTYNTTGTYTTTLMNAAGCDSVVTLNLTITSSNTGSETATSCDSYTWSADGNTYNTTGTYTTTLTNAAGCDSVATLNLTITNSNTASETATSCDSYTWSADGNTYNTTGTYTSTLTNVAGCDSVVTLDLTINSVDSSVTQSGTTLSANEPGATYQWVYCPDLTPIAQANNQIYNPTANGIYAVIVTSNGCSDTSACYTITGVGIIENDFGNELLLYPNPTDGNFSIDLGNSYNGVKITITDMNGKMIRSKTHGESRLLNLTLEEAPGVYLLKIEAEGRIAVIRLLKE